MEPPQHDVDEPTDEPAHPPHDEPASEARDEPAREPVAKPPTPRPVMPPPSPQTAGWDPNPAIRRVGAPALLLILVTVGALLFSLCNTAGAVLQTFAPEFVLRFYANANLPAPSRQELMLGGVLGLGFGVVNLLAGCVIIAGAFQMRRLRAHGLAVVGAILAFVPCVGPCYGCLTFPFGIWALIVLLDPDVRYVFQLNAQGMLPEGYLP